MQDKARMFGSFALATVAGALLLPLVAAGQAPPATKVPVAPKTEQRDPAACAGSDTPSTVGKGDPAGPQTGNKNLSDRLASSSGVICPPKHVDPEIQAPTPPGGSMPVIPPPGSPGGDGSVQPK